MPDTIAPELDHADLLVNGVSLYVFFTETESLPMTHGSEDPFFEVKVDGVVRGYIAPIGWDLLPSLKAAVLLLASPVYARQTVTIKLLGRVSDAAANAAILFDDQPVYNQSEVLPVLTGLVATGGDGSVTLTWDFVDPAEDGVRIERSTDGVIFTAIHDKSTDGVTYTDDTAVNGIAYSYRVKTFTNSPIAESNPSNVAGPVTPQAAGGGLTQQNIDDIVAAVIEGLDEMISAIRRINRNTFFTLLNQLKITGKDNAADILDMLD